MALGYKGVHVRIINTVATTYPAHGGGGGGIKTVASTVSYSSSLVKPSLVGISLFKSAHAGVGQLFIGRRVLKILEPNKKSHCNQ